MGYIFGPLIGAYFSSFAKTVAAGPAGFSAFQYPALFSCLTSVLVFLLLGAFLRETLPSNKRVSEYLYVLLLCRNVLKYNVL